MLIQGEDGDSNTILGNFIGTDVTGSVDLGNTNEGVRIQTGADSNVIGGTAAGTGNVISGNDANDLIFGDHARIAGDIGDGEIDRLPFNEPLAIDYTTFTLLANLHPFVWTSIDTQNADDGGSEDGSSEDGEAAGDEQ